LNTFQAFHFSKNEEIKNLFAAQNFEEQHESNHQARIRLEWEIN